VSCSHWPEQHSLPYRQNAPDGLQFGPPPPPPLPAHWKLLPQSPKQHSPGSSPGVEQCAPGIPHVPPSASGCGAHAVPPWPSAMQLTEQHESAWTHVEPSDRHAVPPEPPKHEPFSQRPLQQLRFCVQNPFGPTHASGTFGFTWHAAVSPSSWQYAEQQSVSFWQVAPMESSVHGASPPLEQAATTSTETEAKRPKARRMAPQP
jgi:hypothetical protein